VYGPYYVIQDALIEHYKTNLRRNTIKVLGSSDMIGNPVAFVAALGLGAKEFFYEPKEGFMKGPLKGGIGIVKGTSSLVKHTLGGAVGSVGKITNSLNKGVLFLSFDDDYSSSKEINDLKHKPKGALDGMVKGFRGLGKSLFSGVTGVVTQPM
jgi:vacuolar protein sorting-associated protein 13A/C